MPPTSRIVLITIAAVAFLAAPLLTSCGKAIGGSNVANAAGTSNGASEPSSGTASGAPEPTAAEDAAKDEPDLLSLGAGAYPVKRLREYSIAYDTVSLMDERSSTGWTSPEGDLAAESLVLSLPEQTVLKKISFDCGYRDHTCAKDFTVEMSDKSADDGFQKIAAGTIEEDKQGQTFTVSAEVPGRWVRLTILNNHGADRFIQLDEFRATGTQLTHTQIGNISGTYDSDAGWMHIKQEGTSVTGCYYTRGGTFEGGVDGRVMKITWCDNCNLSSKATGTALFAFSPDGSEFIGFWEDGSNTYRKLQGWTGKRKSTDVGTCPNWAGAGIEEQTTHELAAGGRVRLYGVNFDTDSDVIKDESKPTLDKMVAILKKNADWKITIEGHTDARASAAHNQALSERRAASVAKYMESQGIAADRLKSIGYGDTKPVADNETEFGRAQNRRVELVKE
jgi:outer membrane protein OmpA-like peptidoglycan-associated protein